MKKYSQGKKLISFALVFALLISLFSILPLTASAAVGDSETVDGVTYTVTSAVYGAYNASVTAFDNSKTDVVIKDKVNIKGTDYTVTDIGTVFKENTKITSVSIPGTVTIVLKEAFDGCTSLKDVTLNEGIVEIQVSAFYNCSIQSITFPKSLKTLDMQAFARCASLKDVYINSDVDIKTFAFNNCKAIENVYCKSKSISFSSAAFSINKEIFKIHGYEGSTAQTFANSKGYTFVVLKEEETTTVEATTAAPTESDDTIFTWKKVNESDGLDGPVQITGFKAGKESTSKVEIPSVINAHPVTIIGTQAFANNMYIKNVTIPASVIVISTNAFYKDKNLESVTFAENSQLQSIGDSAFEGNDAQGFDIMAQIDLPESLKQLGYRAFYNRKSLVTVNIYSKDVTFGTVGKGGEVFNFTDGSKSVINNNIKMYGYTGSTAETYAHETGHTFRYLDLNTDELQSLYDKADAIDSKLYTADSYAELTTAMKAAKRLLGTAGRDATPEQIEDAIEALNAAIDGLVPVGGSETTAAPETTVAVETTIAPETTVAVETTAPIDLEDNLVLLGDADGSGKVDVKDVTHIQKHIASYFTLEGKAALAADVDGSGVIDVNDVTLVQKYLAAYNVEYKIGEVVQFGSDTPAPTADNPQPTDEQSTTASPQPTNAEPEPTTAEPEPTDSVKPSAPDGTTIFYVPNYVSWLNKDGCKLWLYNNDTDEKMAAEEYDENPDGIAGYFYFYLPNDWVNISIYRTKFEITDETFDKDSPWNEETKTGVIFNSWLNIGDRGENNAYKITADGAPGVFETFDPATPKPADDERTIYFDNSIMKWSTVYIYGWNYGLSEEALTMEFEGNDIWSYTFYDTLPMDGVKGFLFTDRYTTKASWTGGTLQTGDLATEAGKNLFIPDGKRDGEQHYTGTWGVYTPK